MNFRALLVLLALATTSAVEAKTKLPNVFSDHMVVQQKMPVHVWGWTNPGQDVTVELGVSLLPARLTPPVASMFRCRLSTPATHHTH
ncbi:MAG UNVERIFIED_CONTAM: hypothetical protein LVR18_50560 [Planctomycetaceae bacterium]